MEQTELMAIPNRPASGWMSPHQPGEQRSFIQGRHQQKKGDRRDVKGKRKTRDQLTELREEAVEFGLEYLSDMINALNAHIAPYTLPPTEHGFDDVVSKSTSYYRSKVKVLSRLNEISADLSAKLDRAIANLKHPEISRLSRSQAQNALFMSPTNFQRAIDRHAG